MFKTFRKIILPGLVLTLFLSLLSVGVGASTYPDPDYWATEALSAAVENKILYGKENGNLDPEANLTRAEMAAIIVRSFGASVADDISGFTDVSPSQWYYNDIAKAVHMGVFVGSGNGQMNPDNNITREEVFTVIARALVLSSSDYSPLSKFGDNASISSWAREYMAPLVQKGYVNGNELGNVTPLANITRAEFAQLMHNIFKTYFSTSGTYETTGADSTMINTANVNLSNLTVDGDLVIGDGGNSGTVVLTNVNIKGRLLVRGSATVRLVNTTVGENVVVKNINSNVHFDNYRTEAVFNGINIITSATFKQDGTIDPGTTGGGGGGGPVGIAKQYKVYHYQQNVDDLTQYTLVDTETKSGYAGQKGTATAKTYQGFTVNNSKSVLSGTIPAMGTGLELKVFYDRNSYQVSFNTDGLATVAPVTRYYGQNIGTLPVPVSNYATFVDWNISPTYVVTKNVTVNANWTYRYADYKIEHYLQKTDLSGYELYETTTKENAKVGSTVTADSNSYDGFTPDRSNANNVLTGIVEDSESSQLTGKPKPLVLKLYYSRNKYEVIFDTDGGSDVASKEVYYGNAIGTLETPTKTGYGFKGWVDGDGNPVDESYIITNGVTIKATWEANKYTVTFNANGGSVTTASMEVTYDSTYPALPVPTNSDSSLNFAGWFDADGNQIAEGNAVKITENTEVYAKWTTELVHHVIIHNYYADGSSYNSTVVNGDKITKPADPVKEGYTFKGFYSNSSMTSSFNFNSIVSGTTVKTVEIYVKWEINKYTVTFDSDGGSSVQKQTVEYNSTATEPAAPTKTGYTFKGWTLNGASYDFSTPVTGDITLKAKWEINKYNVTFDTDGGSTVASQEIEYKGTVTRPDDPTKTGYTFVGWALNNLDYDFSTPVTGDITLKAKWEINKYTVIFATDGGSAVPSQTVEYNSKAAKPAAPTKTGYTFKGWMLNGAEYNFDTPVVEDITITAKWEINKYNVTFNSDGGSVVASQEIEYNGIATKPADPTKTGYTFVGWALNNLDYDFSTPVTGDITLKAKWEINKYNVTFNSDGGSSVASQEIEYNNIVVKPQDPTKSGYNFKGWTLDGEDYDFNTKVTKAIELVAKWEAAKYTVTFDANGGSVTPTSIEVTYDSTYPVLPTPTNSDSSLYFTGWFDNAGNQIATGNKVEITGNITVTAEWSNKVVHNVIFHDYNGEGNDKIENLVDGDKVEMPDTPALDGFSFGGWYADEQYKQEYIFGKIVTGASSVTINIYVKWNALTLDVTFDTNGGSVVPLQEVEYNKTATKPDDPTKEGYIFKGWQLDEVDYDFNTPVTTKITLKAVWEAEQYKVTFNVNGGNAVTPEFITVTYDGIFPALPTPTHSDSTKTFKGWFDNNGNEIKEGDTVKITSDTELVAKWKSEEEKIKVNFYSWGDLIKTVEVEKNDTVSLPTNEEADYGDDDAYMGYVKNPTVASVYTDDYQHRVDFNWWYETDDGWKIFDENVEVTEDTDVYLRGKKLFINVYAGNIGESFPFNIWYEDETRIIDSVKNLMYTQLPAYIGRTENDHLEVINLALSLVDYDDTLKQKLIDFNIIDENDNILIQEFMLRYSQVLGADNVKQFIVDSAKESFKSGDNEKLNDSIEEFITTDKEGIKNILSRTNVSADAKAYIVELAGNKYSEELFMSEVGYTGASKEDFIAAVENNSNGAYIKVVEYLVNHSDIEPEYAVNITTYISYDSSLKDEIVDGILDTVYKADLELLVKEVKNEEQFTVTDRTVFVAEGLGNKLQAEYGYDKIISKIPHTDKLFKVYPEDKLREIYQGAFDRLLSQIEAAKAEAEAGNTAYIDCGLNFIINPVDDIYVPLYDSLVEQLNGKVGNKLYYGEDENAYLVEIVKLFDANNLFNETLSDETLSGYALKDFDDYYDLMYKLTVLSDDAVTWYKSEFSEEEIDEILLGYEELALKYANLAAEYLEDFADGDITNSYVTKVEQLINSKAPGLLDKVLDWYKTSSINKEYESDDYAKFRRGIREAYEKYDLMTDGIFDDEYINKVLSKLDRILVSENVSYTDYAGVVHPSADIYQITVKGITGSFAVIGNDMYEIKIKDFIITIARDITEY